MRLSKIDRITAITLIGSFCLFLLSTSSLKAQSTEVRLEKAQEFYFKGLEEARKGNIEAAIDFYSNALKLNSGYYEAFNNRGVMYLRKRQFDLAIADFSTAITLRKPSAGIFLNLSHAYYGRGDYAKALENVDRAFEVEPKLSQGWATRGMINRRQKEYEAAIRDYTKAIEIKTDSYGFSGRCLTHYDFGKYEKAAADCSEAISLKPSSMAYYYRALARTKLDQNALAISDLRKSLEIDPKFKEAKDKLDSLLKIHKY